MANGLNLKGGGLGKLAGDAAIGALAGGGSDFIIEITRLPYLNDPSPLFPNMSNAESFIYGIGGLTFVVGLVSALSKSSFGAKIGTDAAAKGLGAVLGTWLYETQVAPRLGGLRG